MTTQANYYSMRPAFELHLNKPLLEGLATIGRFDGKTPSLVCATSAHELIVHTSESLKTVVERGGRGGRDTSVAPLRTLNFGELPTALVTGRVRDTAARKGVDALYFGSSTSLLAYDVEQNSEYFYKKMEDGVHAVVCGVVNTTRCSGDDVPSQLVIVGGNCTVNGFDESGAEMLWTVTGDQVTALMLMPWDKSASVEPSNKPLSLVAASEDFELRVFDGEEAVASIMEVDRVNQLVYSGIPGRFAYVSANGTVGVYDRTERLWRVKGKHRPVSAAFCDVDFDGVPELIVGWSNGRVEVRGDDVEKRGVLFRETYAAPVSAVLADDYRQNGQPLPIVCTVDGTVRGLQLTNTKGGADVVHGREVFKLDALRRERQMLATELAWVEEQLARHQKGDTDATLPQAGAVVRYKLLPNPKSGQLDVDFTVHHGHPDTIIQGCILHSEAIFPGGEYAFFTVEEPSPTLLFGLDIPRNVEAHVVVSVMVGATNAEKYQIHELSFTIPRFIMYQLWVDGPEAVPFRYPAGCVTVQLPPEFPFGRLREWLGKTFRFSPDSSGTSSDFQFAFVDLQNGGGLMIEGDSKRCEVQIRGDTMEVCCDVVETLAEGAVVDEATAQCHFPEETCELRETLQRVEEFDMVRLKLNSNLADMAASIKPLLVRAEDSRLITNISGMRRSYAQLYDLNKELLAENMKRCTNYSELKTALKKVNAFITKAGRLRIGKARTRLIAECRDCVKVGDTQALVNLICSGQK